MKKAGTAPGFFHSVAEMLPVAAAGGAELAAEEPPSAGVPVEPEAAAGALLPLEDEDVPPFAEDPMLVVGGPDGAMVITFWPELARGLASVEGCSWRGTSTACAGGAAGASGTR